MTNDVFLLRWAARQEKVPHHTLLNEREKRWDFHRTTGYQRHETLILGRGTCRPSTLLWSHSNISSVSFGALKGIDPLGSKENLSLVLFYRLDGFSGRFARIVAPVLFVLNPKGFSLHLGTTMVPLSVCLRDWDWWGNLLYLIGSIGYGVMDFSAGWCIDGPFPQFMDDDVATILWIAVAVVFVFDSLLYGMGWLSYAWHYSKITNTPVR